MGMQKRWSEINEQIPINWLDKKRGFQIQKNGKIKHYNFWIGEITRNDSKKVLAIMLFNHPSWWPMNEKIVFEEIYKILDEYKEVLDIT